MKTILVLGLLSTAVYCAPAQERVSLDNAQKGARVLIESAGKIGDAPFKLEVDLDRPDGLKAGEVRILVIPGQKLTAEALAAAGKTILPLGQLWMLAIAPAQEGKAIASDKMRVVTVAKEDKDYKVLLLFLGLQRTEKGELELLIFGKDKEPLFRRPLEKITAQQELPIELQGRKDGEGAGTLTLSILGKYKVEVPVRKPGE